MEDVLNRARPSVDEDDGFTLIELLVVVVIIGILVAIAIPLYLNYRKGAENKSAQSDLRGAVPAVEACIEGNGGKAPGIAGGGANLYAYDRPIYLTCKSDGSGVASLSAPSAADKDTSQTINVSPGSALFYVSYTTSWTMSARYDSSPSDHKLYTYVSATGKTSTS